MSRKSLCQYEDEAIYQSVRTSIPGLPPRYNRRNDCKVGANSDRAKTQARAMASCMKMKTVELARRNDASCRPSDDGEWSSREPDSVRTADQTAKVDGRFSARVEILETRLRIGQIAGGVWKKDEFVSGVRP
jgi:hypothetical protein